MNPSEDPEITQPFASSPDSKRFECDAGLLPVIANYQIDRMLGQGGFGKVYLATRKSDGQPFAIKLLSTTAGQSDETRMRFLREATVLCQLNHPRIVAFRELGITGNDFYIVMDYVQSVSWREVRGTLSAERQIRIAVGIIDYCLDALTYAHDLGIVHRDLKPANILLERTDNKVKVRIADFGLAKNYINAGHSGVTSDNEIAGTFCYMAPELIGGVKYFKPASDRYSVAATLFEMLTDRPPLKIQANGNPLLELRRHNVPQVQSLNPLISNDLSAWIHKGLSKEPDHRFESTQQMRDALKAAL